MKPDTAQPSESCSAGPGGAPAAGEWLTLAGLTLLAALLRFPFLSRFGLWLDEIYVRQNALEPLAENLQTVHFVHFLAVKPGLALWDNPFGLRLASACFGVAAVPLGWYAARRALGVSTARLFAFFLAVVPYFINYSIDANYYSHVIFWAMAGLATAFIAYDQPRLWLFPPLAAFGLMAFFVHPFSAAFFATTALVMAISTFARWRPRKTSGKAEAAPARLRARFAGFGIAGLLLVILVWAMSGTTAGRKIAWIAGRFAEMIEAGESPTNIEFSLAFFENYFRRIGPAYYALEDGAARGGLLMIGATAGLFAFFCAGLWVMRRKPEHAATIVLPFVLSFVVIFNLKADRHFNLRYFSVLVPLYWLSIAAALTRGAEGLAARVAPEGNSKRLLIQGAPFAAILLLFVPQYAHLGFTDGRNWDEVVPAIADRIEPGEPIVFTNWAEETMLPHYQRIHNLRDVPLKKLPHTDKRHELTAAMLRDLCYRTSSLWFVSSWLAIQSPQAVAWAESRMESVARGESVFSSHYNVTAYHWCWGGRYLLAPRILDYRPEAKDFRGEEFSQRFLVETPLSYRLEVVLQEDAGDLKPELAVDGRALPLQRKAEDKAGRAVMAGETRLDQGEHQVIVRGVRPAQMRNLRFIPLYPEGAVPLAASDVSDFYPSDYVWSPEREGGTWLCLKRNTFASYDFGIPREGIYELTVEGLHDRPPPVWIELRLDGDALGVIQFQQGNAREATRHVPLRLKEGNHTLTARFLNEGNVQSDDPDVDRDAWIRRFEFRPVDAPRRDDRVYVPRRGWARIGLAREGETNLAKGWSTITDGDLNPQLVEADIPGGLAWKASLPRNSKGLLLKSPVLPAPPERVVYLSALLRTRDLLNHSANMKVYYLDAAGERVGETVVNQEGIYRTTDWVRFVEFQPVPEGVAYVQALFWVYPNSRRPASTTGEAYFGDLRLETGGRSAESGSAP